MKTIPLTFDEKDYLKFKRFREANSKAKSWEKFVMELIDDKQRTRKHT